MTLAEDKAAVRRVAFAARKAAFDLDRGGASGMLSSVLAGHRGVPLAGYMPMRSEIDPLPAMAEAAAHGPVAVPVIMAAAQPLRFSRWTPEAPMRDGPFGARVPEVEDFLEPEILIVPLVAFTRSGGRLGYGGGFYDRTLQGLRARRATLAIGFAYGAQQMQSLPLEPTDQPLDLIVTDTEIIDVSGGSAPRR
ncbi:MAG: 5-formyltetrahydrofolate cyclo-ligase [Pseudomonadota bacterium]